jgi:hypothetical protein
MAVRFAALARRQKCAIYSLIQHHRLAGLVQQGRCLMTIQALSRPEGWFKQNAKTLLDLLWNATLVMTFAFAAFLALAVAVGLAVETNLIKIPDRICIPDSPASGVKQICN